MKCDFCDDEGTRWRIEINQENTRIFSGALCIKHYHELVDVIVTLVMWRARRR